MILLAAALALAGCRGDSSNNANSTAQQAGGESNTTTTTTRQTTTQPTPTQATPTQPTPAATSGTGATDSLPITDAAAFRDRLLALAQSVSFASQASVSSNATAIREAWQKQYPGLKFSIFYSMAADPNTVSSSDTFLISGSETAGRFDQLYAFAVADAKGKCAGGAAVIPGDDAKRKVSDAKVPTLFKPIDMSNAKSCTGETAGENYKP
jgi:hypothetical protein